MSDYKYIVRLYPVGSYFFGGEVTFGDGETQNYLVRSRLLPQASALLGLMRYVILEQNNLLDKGDSKVRDRWPELIGKASFNIEDPQDRYGIISSISPVFVEKQGLEPEFFTPCPLDYSYDVKVVSGSMVSYSSTCCHPLYLITKQGDDFSWKDFKNYGYWASSRKESAMLEESSLFQYDERVGITKNGGSLDGKKAFFKQSLVRMAEGYNFIFTLATSKDILEGKEIGVSNVRTAGLDQIVYLGGNRSAFRMTVTRMEEEKDPVTLLSDALRKENRVLLLSDAYITAEERDGLDFIWGNCIDNRYVSDTHSWRKGNRSDLYHLLSRGSVIYHSDSKALKNFRESKSKLNNVGLNIFV